MQIRVGLELAETFRSVKYPLAPGGFMVSVESPECSFLGRIVTISEICGAICHWIALAMLSLRCPFVVRYLVLSAGPNLPLLP